MNAQSPMAASILVRSIRCGKIYATGSNVYAVNGQIQLKDNMNIRLKGEGGNNTACKD